MPPERVAGARIVLAAVPVVEEADLGQRLLRRHRAAVRGIGRGRFIHRPNGN